MVVDKMTLASVYFGSVCEEDIDEVLKDSGRFQDTN